MVGTRGRQSLAVAGRLSCARSPPAHGSTRLPSTWRGLRGSWWLAPYAPPGSGPLHAPGRPCPSLLGHGHQVRPLSFKTFAPGPGSPQWLQSCHVTSALAWVPVGDRRNRGKRLRVTKGQVRTHSPGKRRGLRSLWSRPFASDSAAFSPDPGTGLRRRHSIQFHRWILLVSFAVVYHINYL